MIDLVRVVSFENYDISQVVDSVKRICKGNDKHHSMILDLTQHFEDASFHGVGWPVEEASEHLLKNGLVAVGADHVE